MGSSLLDVCRFSPTLGGTTDWTYASTVTGYLAPAGAGAVNGQTYSYRAESNDLSQFEEGFGAYNSGTGTFARSTVTSNSAGTTAKINFTTAPLVAIVALSRDLVTPAVIRGYIGGLALSTAGTSATFSVSAGVAVDSTNIDWMTLASAMSKTTSAWASGTGNGGLDTGAIANATWYHAYVIKRPDTGAVDVLFSLSATAPTLPTNYTLFRRIGSIKTNGSAQWIKFIQIGDDFLWDVAVTDINASTSITTTNTQYTLPSLPLGVSVLARLRVIFGNSAAATGFLISSPLTTTQLSGTPVGNASGVTQVAGGFCDFEMYVWIDTAQHVNASASSAANNTLYLTPAGWTDRRGKDA